MKELIIISFIACLLSCNGYDASPVWVQAGVDGMTTEKGIVKMNDVVFTGNLYCLYPAGDTEYVRSYVAGRLNGESRGWYAGGQLKFVYHYKDDVYDGSVEEWFSNGQQYRSFNYVNGQEEGLQKMYWDNGTLRANYESKNGRKYGFTGIKNCTTPWSDSTGGLPPAGM